MIPSTDTKSVDSQVPLLPTFHLPGPLLERIRSTGFTSCLLHPLKTKRLNLQKIEKKDIETVGHIYKAAWLLGGPVHLRNFKGVQESMPAYYFFGGKTLQQYPTWLRKPPVRKKDNLKKETWG